MPYVVRETENELFELIGEAYLCGIIHGEAWFAEYEEKTIVLQ